MSPKLNYNQFLRVDNYNHSEVKQLKQMSRGQSNHTQQKKAHTHQKKAQSQQKEAQTQQKLTQSPEQVSVTIYITESFRY